MKKPAWSLVPVSYCFLAWPILPPWRCRAYYLLHTGALLALCFDSEAGDDMFLRNVSWTNYTALYRRRQNSLQPPLWEPQILHSAKFDLWMQIDFVLILVINVFCILCSSLSCPRTCNDWQYCVLRLFSTNNTAALDCFTSSGNQVSVAGIWKACIVPHERNMADRHSY
jgi:hypothetical protein